MKKTILTLVILLLGFNCLLAQFSGGNGTAGDPWQISNTTDLSFLSTNSGYWSDYFVQTTDINAPLGSFSPIGNTTTYFRGSYDGDEHTIDGLYISNSGNNCGLFGHTSGANIIDLGVINVNISAYEQVGGLVGANYGTVSNCYSTGSVNGTYSIGGLVGRNLYGTVSNCYSTGSVNGYASFGGLVGWNCFGTVSNCYSTGSVNGGSYVGGLVGFNQNASVSNCYSTGSVNGGSYVGGLVGYNHYGTVSNCYSTGSVTGSGNYVGGLVGRKYYGTVSNCYSTGSVNGSGSYVGGLVGYNPGTVVSNSFWDRETSGQSTSEGGTGKTTAEMQTQSTFTSVGWDFTTIWQIIGINYPDLINNPRPTEPFPPILLQPTNGSTILTLTPSLDWNDVNGASSYNVQVSLYDNPFVMFYESTDLTESQHTIPVELLTTNTVYYWRANASNTGGTSTWSDSWNFQTYATPSENTEMLDSTIDSMIVAGILNTGNGNSLKVILNSALDKINQGKFKAAINKLNAFINKVEAFISEKLSPKRGQKLTPEQGQDLIDRANAIIEQLSEDVVNLIPEIPEVFSLIQNYPNPFNPTTRIDYSLPFDSKVSLQIFDALGREVITLVNENQRAGYYTVDFNASNLASGIYYYRMSAGDFSTIKKMVVIK